jgi:glycosyltransferase involved in cell wall biosynthesis
MKRTCILNVGLYRSGTTTIAEAASELGLKSDRAFPELSTEELQEILCDPVKAIRRWKCDGGFEKLIERAEKYDLICDGWVALLPFLNDNELEELKEASAASGVKLIFIATKRDVEGTVISELHHWVRYDLERRVGLDFDKRSDLENSLLKRAQNHEIRVQELASANILKILRLSENQKVWTKELSTITAFSATDWENALKKVGKCDANPSLPVEGVLLTLRIETGVEAVKKVNRLLDQLEQDRLCRYIVVLGIDDDEKDSPGAAVLIDNLKEHEEQQNQLESFHIIINPVTEPDKPFPICNIWDDLASRAWKEGADWVTLFGDDVEVECPFHYRAMYRAFLDISKNLNVPFGFGCPWWNDKTFPNFPSFICVGRAHYEIFGGLIPVHRKEVFVNQDLDPYTFYLYVKFQAAPCVKDAMLSNEIGGHIGSGDAPRYERVPAKGWKDFVLDDIDPIREFLSEKGAEIKEDVLLDIIVPSYRVHLDYLESITSLQVPKGVHAHFIVIVDNPALLIARAIEIQACKDDLTMEKAERILEAKLTKKGNTVRVRSNHVNVGASASRNRGLDESAAEWVLHLDDDLTPNEDLLEQYCRNLFKVDDSVVGFIGLVRFPRSQTLPLKHAAVLMSYLTFMFEISQRGDLYGDDATPAWGVTANILFRRTTVRFDAVYAKTGGGEDVDYSLKVTEACDGGRLLPVPEACVVHPFWPGSVFTLAHHFYSWAIGDGALFKRFPQHCHWSFPNVPETLFFVLPMLLLINGLWACARVLLLFLVADFAVDAFNLSEYAHRCELLQQTGNGHDLEEVQGRSPLFHFAAHILANLYVVILECGRLRGHIGRGPEDIRHGVFRRFDWHIGRLPNAPRNFRKREACKFSLFVVIVAYEVQSLRS